MSGMPYIHPAKKQAYPNATVDIAATNVLPTGMTKSFVVWRDKYCPVWFFSALWIKYSPSGTWIAAATADNKINRNIRKWLMFNNP